MSPEIDSRLSHPTESAHPERILPDDCERGILNLHLARYAFAVPQIQGQRILDLACGVGYGAHYLLEEGAESVVAVDVSLDALVYARARYPHRALDLACCDAMHLPFRRHSIDAVTAFECIEHFDDPGRVLSQVAQVLTPRGVLFISTPRVSVTTHKPSNPYHRIEYSPDDFVALLEAYFEEVDVLGQRRLQSATHRILQRLDVLGLRRWFIPRSVRRATNAALETTSIEDLTLDDILIDNHDLHQATELIGVCRRPKQSPRE